MSHQSISISTTNITRALCELATRYPFVRARCEYLYFPQRGKESEKADVAFFLHPGDRLLFLFEIDNVRREANSNRLKLFADVPQAIPITTLAVLHDRVANRFHGYPQKILANSSLPPRFLDSISISTDSYNSILQQLTDWLDRVFWSLATDPLWGTVIEVSSHYQNLVVSGGLPLASAHLETQSELAWRLASQGFLDIERAACLTISLARMLQRAGYHHLARQQMQLLRSRVPNTASLSQITADIADSVTFLLGNKSGDDVFTTDHLARAIHKIRTPQFKAQFLWRSAVAKIRGGDQRQVEDVIQAYREILADSTAANSNIALLRTLAALAGGRGDPCELASAYGRIELFLLKGITGAPDGTLHGIVASLYLKLFAALSVGNRSAQPLLRQLDAFCRTAKIPETADGIREIKAAFPEARTILLQENERPPLGLLWPLTNGQLLTHLDTLCAKVDFAYYGCT